MAENQAAVPEASAATFACCFCKCLLFCKGNVDLARHEAQVTIR
jgi:hypothetical protein